MTEASSGQSVAGISVVAFTAAGRRLNTYDAVTDKKGHYRINGLRASSKGVFVCAGVNDDGIASSPAMLAPACYRNTAWDGAAANLPGSAPRVRLTAHQQRTGVDIALPAAGAISGRVTAAGSSTGLFDFGIVVYNQHGQVVRQGSSNSSGNYTFQGLAPSTAGYVVCFPGAGQPGPDGDSGSTPYLGQCYANADWPY